MADMIPKKLIEELARNAAESNEGARKDHAPVVKLHSKYGKPIWLLSELDEENQIAYGLCDLGQGKPELGYVSLGQLEAIKHARLRVPMVEIDSQFAGKYPMSVYLKAALANKRITEDEDLLLQAALTLGHGK